MFWKNHHQNKTQFEQFCVYFFLILYKVINLILVKNSLGLILAAIIYIHQIIYIYNILIPFSILKRVIFSESNNKIIFFLPQFKKLYFLKQEFFLTQKKIKIVIDFKFYYFLLGSIIKYVLYFIMCKKFLN